jgi:pectate lyase
MGGGGGAPASGAAGATQGGASGATGGSSAAGKAGMSGGGGSAGAAGASGSAGANSCPGFVLCETFEDGDFTANPNWLATPNAFSVIDDGGSKVLKQQASSEAWAYAGVATWSDVTIQARVKVLDFMGTSSTNCGGLVARWQGSSNPNYVANLCAKGTVGIYKDGDLVDETNGTKTMTLAVNTWYALKFRVSGKPGAVSLTLSINDMPVIAVTDSDTSTPVAAGYVAVGSKKAISMEYDDIQVSAP